MVLLLAARGFMHTPLEAPAKEMGVTLINEKDEKAMAQGNTVTHLMALLGHLKLSPEQLSPENPLFTTDEQAVARVKNSLDSRLKGGKKLGVVFLGEDRGATLMGGKKLPHNPEEHGRHLEAKAFEGLLRKHKDLILVDCNSPKSHIQFEDDDKDNLLMSAEFEKRVVTLPKEQTPFDSIMALGRVVSIDRPNYVGFGADNGPTNMFGRSLTKKAQRRFAFIIPNPEEYDMRMEGDGDSYTQMISNCRVYKCPAPDQQEATIEKAFDDIEEGDNNNN